MFGGGVYRIGTIGTKFSRGYNIRLASDSRTNSKVGKYIILLK